MLQGHDIVCFANDWESDPLIYSLYAELVAGALPLDLLQRLLEVVEVQKGAIDHILKLAGMLVAPSPGAVRRIYINLERRTPPSHFRAFGPRLVPFVEGGLLVRDGARLRLTREGMLVANEIMAVFV